MFLQIGLKQKIILFTVLVSIIPMTMMIFMYMQISQKTGGEETLHLLEAVCVHKKDRLEDYFASLSGLARTIAGDPSVLSLWQNAKESPSLLPYSPPALRRLQEFMDIGQPESIRFIFPQKNKTFFLEKGSSDFRSADTLSPIPGDLSGESEKGTVRFSDMVPDDVSGSPTAFVLTALADNSGGFLALPLSLQKINAIMQERTGLGKSGDAYLVGQDKLLRSDSFLEPQQKTVQYSFAHRNVTNTPPVREVLSGKSASLAYKDGKGNRLLASFLPVDNGGLRWGLIAETDLNEVSAKQKHLQSLSLIMGMMMLLLTLSMGFIFARAVSRQVEMGLAETERLPKKEQIAKFEKEMQKAADEQQFEKAAYFRDKIRRLKGQAVI
ncbi:MAG: UvrB/UvrC motif-containing protein [Desulfococcaceae bacterium]|jgi:hypothetical protein|nr:UvrB/UvrC motif-containing protein [Desulfococcaceae bacterium]